MRERRWHTCDRAGDDGCGRGCGLFTGPVLTRIRGVCKLPKQSANATQIRTGCGHIIINTLRGQNWVDLFATHAFTQPRLRICRPLHAPCKRVASDAVEASLQHLWLKLQAPRRYRGEFCSTHLQEASWRAHLSSSSPPPTPQPHSTAQHRPSHDQSTIAPGIRWPGAAAKRQSPTRPRSSVV